jgi:hypothetical protein
MRDDRGQQRGGVGGGVLPLGELFQVGDRGGRGAGVASWPSNAGSGTAILLDDEGDAPEQIRHHHISWQLVLRWDFGRVKSIGGLRDA